MRNLNITKGEWRLYEQSRDAKLTAPKNGLIKIVCDDKCLGFIGYPWTVCEVPKSVAMADDGIFNAQLITDAGTTANKCGLLPSELLEQRDMLLDLANDTLRVLDAIEKHSGLGVAHKYLKKECLEAIQKCQ